MKLAACGKIYLEVVQPLELTWFYLHELLIGDLGVFPILSAEFEKETRQKTSSVDRKVDEFDLAHARKLVYGNEHKDDATFIYDPTSMVRVQ